MLPKWQTSLTHKECIYYKNGICLRTGAALPADGPACPNFTPKTTVGFGFKPQIMPKVMPRIIPVFRFPMAYPFPPLAQPLIMYPPLAWMWWMKYRLWWLR